MKKATWKLILFCSVLLLTKLQAQKVQVMTNGVLLDDSLICTGYFSPAKFQFIIENGRYKIKNAKMTIKGYGSADTLYVDSNYLYANPMPAGQVAVSIIQLYDLTTKKDTSVNISFNIKTKSTRSLDLNERKAINDNPVLVYVNGKMFDCNSLLKIPKKELDIKLKMPDDSTRQFSRCEVILVRGFRPVAAQQSPTPELKLKGFIPNMQNGDFLLIQIVAKDNHDNIKKIFSKAISIE
jgi:hypothetical protein